MAAEEASTSGERLRLTRQAKNEQALLSGMREGRFEPRSTAVVVIDMINCQLSLDCAIGMYQNFGVSCDYMLEARRVAWSESSASPGCSVCCRCGGGIRAHGQLPAGRIGCAPVRVPMLRAWRAQDGKWACDVIDEIKPVDGDLSLIKTGSSCFGTSALDSHLRNIGIEHVLYTGVLTNACVMLTVAAGFDLRYRNYLVTDATATFTQHLQDQAEELMGGYLAENIKQYVLTR